MRALLDLRMHLPTPQVTIILSAAPSHQTLGQSTSALNIGWLGNKKTIGRSRLQRLNAVILFRCQPKLRLLHVQRALRSTTWASTIVIVEPVREQDGHHSSMFCSILIRAK